MVARQDREMKIKVETAQFLDGVLHAEQSATGAASATASVDAHGRHGHRRLCWGGFAVFFGFGVLVGAGGPAAGVGVAGTVLVSVGVSPIGVGIRVRGVPGAPKVLTGAWRAIPIISMPTVTGERSIASIVLVLGTTLIGRMTHHLLFALLAR